MSRLLRTPTPHPRRGRPIPVHVVLLPAVPVMMLWAGNAEEVRTLVPLHISVFVGLLSALLAATTFVVQRDVRRGALVVATSLTLSGAFGHVVTQPSWHVPGLVGLAAIVVTIAVAAARVSDELMARITLVLNVVAVVVIATNAVQVVLNTPTRVINTVRLDGEPRATAEDGLDVWYIAPDRLPDLELLEELGVDTRGLDDALRARGFQVADQAWANYPTTQTSLASAWSGQPLDHDDPASLQNQAVATLRDPPIGRAFVDAGYEYVHLGTWLDDTATSRSATRTLTLHGPGEFYDAVDRGSILPALRNVVNLGVPGFATVERRQQVHAHHQFEVLADLARTPTDDGTPRFVLTHVTLPHPPYVFHADGSAREGPLPPDRRRLAYEEQLAFFSAALLDIVDDLLSRDAPPVIIIMADEGVYPEDIHPVNRPPLNVEALTDDQLRAKMSILATAHDPTGSLGVIQDISSPIEMVDRLLAGILDRPQNATPDIGIFFPDVAGEEPVYVDVSHRIARAERS